MDGNPTKKRGLILRNLEELKEFKNLINNEAIKLIEEPYSEEDIDQS